MKRFHLHHLGRFGNQLFGYAFARGYCERHGLELHTDPWIGEQIFEISHPRCDEELPRIEETMVGDAFGDVSYRSYSQSQQCADFYTVEQCRRWFKFLPDIRSALSKVHIPDDDYLVAHVRHGDFKGYGYALCAEASYRKAADEFGYAEHEVRFVREESPLIDRWFGTDLEFLPDFFRLMRAPILFRANSSFSFWPALLGEHERVFSPVIDGLAGGQEHDVRFVEGNHPRLSHHAFVTELHVAK